MNRIYVKWGLLAVLVIGMVWLFAIGSWGWALLVLLLAILLGITLWLDERNLLALLHMRRQKFDQAEKVLASVRHPEHMRQSQEAYHYFLRGTIESQKRNLRDSDRWYRKALSSGLQMDMDIAMAKMSLAASAIARRRKREATTYLTEAKKHDKQGMLNEQIKMLKEQLKRI